MLWDEKTDDDNGLSIWEDSQDDTEKSVATDEDEHAVLVFLYPRETVWDVDEHDMELSHFFIQLFIGFFEGLGLNMLKMSGGYDAEIKFP